jgi:prefoldin subunit 5
MKTTLKLMTAAALLCGSLNAQVQLFLDEKEVQLPDGKVTAWVFPIPGTQEEVMEDMKDYTKDRSDIKMKKEEDNLYVAEKISLPSISTRRGDLVAYFFEADNYKALAIAFKLGYDISLDSKMWKDEMEHLHSYTRAFMAFHYEQSYARHIDVLDKELKDVEKERKQTEHKVNNMNEKVADLGKKIGKETDTEKINGYEADINELEADIRQLMDTMPGLGSRIEELNKELNRLRTESHNHQGTIGNL